MITWLTKLPLVTSVFGFLKQKPRLVIEYGLIATVVILGGFTVTQWCTKVRTEARLQYAEVQLDAVSARLVVVELVNATHEQTIADLQELRERDAVALAGLMSDYRRLTLRDAQVRSELDALQQNNHHVRNYLAHPIPADLARVLTASQQQQPNTAGNKGGDPN